MTRGEQIANAVQVICSHTGRIGVYVGEQRFNIEVTAARGFDARTRHPAWDFNAWDQVTINGHPAGNRSGGVRFLLVAIGEVAGDRFHDRAARDIRADAHASHFLWDDPWTVRDTLASVAEISRVAHVFRFVYGRGRGAVEYHGQNYPERARHVAQRVRGLRESCTCEATWKDFAARMRARCKEARAIGLDRGANVARVFGQ